MEIPKHYVYLHLEETIEPDISGHLLSGRG